jgi:uncharacterized protein with beta-barrel porin domain
LEYPAKLARCERAFRLGGLDIRWDVAYRRGKLKIMTSLFPGVARKRIRYRFAPLSFVVMCMLGAAAFAPSGAFAACSPATGNNVTVTCSGATVDQGPGANRGYGDGTQNGLTINVQAGPPPASVTGISIGIDVGSNNTINNFGTITTGGNGVIGDVFGINANGANLTVNNSGTIGRLDNLIDTAGINIQGTGLSVTNNAGATIQGASGIQGFGVGTVVNSGLIVGGGGADGINFAGNNTSMVTVTNNATGVITGDANGINANSAIVFNYGTISGAGLGSTGVNANTLVLTNYASGLITGDGFGVSGLQSPNLTITNFGTISGTGLGTFGVLGNVVTIVNSGTISATSGGNALQAILMASGSVTNNANGLITSDSVAITSGGNTTVFNAGTVTGNGGTAISFSGGGNTLTLGPGSVINGTAHGFGADTFRLGGTGTDTFNASLFATQYSGYTTFSKIGASTWTLIGTNATAMPWTVSAGRLDVNGLIVNSTMTVNAGGTLGGTGTVGSTAIAGGTLAPGSAAGSVFGPLAVQGTLSFTAASTYMIQVAPANAGRTNVLGIATLGGATVNAVFLPGSYVNRQYIIVNSANAVSGTFNPTVISNMANIQSTLTYDAHDAFLNIKLSFVPPPSGSLNINQQNVANALTNFFNSTGSIPAVFAALGPAGLTQISGEVATGSQQTTFDAMNLFLGLLTDPFIAGRGDPVSSSTGAPGFADENDSASAYAANRKARTKSERDAYAAIYRKAPAMADPFTQRWSVWAAGYGGSQTTDGNAALGSGTATSRVFGTAVGADYRFSPFTLAGFALAGGGTNFSISNGLGSGRSDLFQAGAFVRHTVGPAYISAALAYGWQDITTDRTVTIAGVDQLRAKFNANAFSGRVEGGYRFVTPWMGVTPYAAAQFTTFDLPAYAEQAVAGANTFALAYGAKSVTATRSEFGIRTDKSFAMQNAILTLRGRFAWAHDFNADRNIAATFQALPGASFVVNGAAQAHDAALTTASAEMKWLNGFSLAATFEGEFSDVTRSYAGKGVVRYTW